MLGLPPLGLGLEPGPHLGVLGLDVADQVRPQHEMALRPEPVRLVSQLPPQLHHRKVVNIVPEVTQLQPQRLPHAGLLSNTQAIRSQSEPTGAAPASMPSSRLVIRPPAPASIPRSARETRSWPDHRLLPSTSGGVDAKTTSQGRATSAVLQHPLRNFASPRVAFTLTGPLPTTTPDRAD